MFNGILQPTHLLLILAIVLIIFGAGKLPEVGKSLGTGIREFRASVGDPNAPAPVAVIRPAGPATPGTPETQEPAAMNAAVPQDSSARR